MEQFVVNRILDIQETLRSDPGLMAEHEAAQRAFLTTLPELTEKHRDILWDYLGVCVEIHLRMLALACGEEEK